MDNQKLKDTNAIFFSDVISNVHTFMQNQHQPSTKWIERVSEITSYDYI